MKQRRRTVTRPQAEEQLTKQTTVRLRLDLLKRADHWKAEHRGDKNAYLQALINAGLEQYLDKLGA